CTNKPTIETRNGSRLGRREDTAINAPQQDDRQSKAPRRALERSKNGTERGKRVARVFFVRGIDAAVGDENRPNQQSWEQTGRKQLADGGTRDGTVDNQRNTWRHDRPQRPRRRNEPYRKILVVPRCNH